MRLQERMRGVERRDNELKQRVIHHKAVEDEFYNVRVEEITTRHNAELARLEALVLQQLQLSADFQKQLDETRNELNLNENMNMNNNDARNVRTS